VGRRITTVAAASVVAAVAFVGYATGSAGIVTGAVDDVLVRSEKPKPKWERPQTRRNKDDGSSGAFRRRVVRGGSKARSKPVYASRFERVLHERMAARAKRRAQFEERLNGPARRETRASHDPFREQIEGGSARPAAPRGSDFLTRDRKKQARRARGDEHPFEKRPKGSGK
jgi:hypothetical protein